LPLAWRISIFPENCTGCRICQMICSWLNEKSFQPLNAYIQVKSEEEKGIHFEIALDQRCKKCGLCASYCSIGALVKEREVSSIV